MNKPEEIKDWLKSELPVHYHRGDIEPRLTTLKMIEIEAMHAETLAYINQLESKLAELEKHCDAEQENASAAIRECAEVKARCLEQIKVYADKLAEYEKPLMPMNFVEAMNADDLVWLEMNAENDRPRIAEVAPCVTKPEERAEILLMGQSRVAHLPYNHYGSSWRCWSRRPTDEERKAAKWDD